MSRHRSKSFSSPQEQIRQELQDERKRFWAFAEKVRTMRGRQRDYFRTRDKNDLIQSKRIEKQIDDYLQELFEARQ